MLVILAQSVCAASTSAEPQPLTTIKSTPGKCVEEAVTAPSANDAARGSAVLRRGGRVVKLFLYSFSGIAEGSAVLSW